MYIYIYIYIYYIYMYVCIYILAEILLLKMFLLDEDLNLANKVKRWDILLFIETLKMKKIPNT